MPYVKALEQFGPRSIVVLAALGDRGEDPVKVLESSPITALQTARIHRSLVVALGAAALAAVMTIAATTMISFSLDDQASDVMSRIAKARSIATKTPGSPTETSIEIVGQRKQSSPTMVLVLDALSQVLPDHTYVTELRIEGDKLQLTGVTRDAPSLIALLEQTGKFTKATFFAPTTRLPSEPGEHFHIETHIQSVALAKS
jgi:general secretion pathway protein L